MLDSKTWDYRFLQLAENVATWSKDPSTKVGSVIVDDKRRVIGLGYNGFPRGVEDTVERYSERETKYLFVCHAERNALDNAPGSVENATLFVTLFPCNECCKSVIQRGIKRIVTFVPSPGKSVLHNHEISYTMLKEAGIALRQYDRSLFEGWKNGNVISGQNEGRPPQQQVQSNIHEKRWHDKGHDVHSDGIFYRPLREKNRSYESND